MILGGKSKKYWQGWQEWIHGLYKGELSLAERRKTAAKDGKYFSHAGTVFGDMLKLTALQDPMGEEVLDYTLELLEKAEEIDDHGNYGKQAESSYEEEIMGQSYTTISIGNVEDEREPFHDVDLGRALRGRYLFIARWLKRGERDLDLLNRTIERMKAWLDFQFGLPKESPEANRTADRPEIHMQKAMCWALEAERFDLPKEYYLRYIPQEYQLKPPLPHWKRLKAKEHIFYLLAAQATGEMEVSDFIGKLLDREYKRSLRRIINKEWGRHLDTEMLGFAYLRAKTKGLSTEPRELLVKIREDS